MKLSVSLAMGLLAMVVIGPRGAHAIGAPVSNAAIDCIQTSTCDLQESALSGSERFALFTVVASTIDVGGSVVMSVQQLIVELNNFTANVQFVPMCLDSFSSIDGPLTLVSNFDFKVTLRNIDGDLLGTPPFQTTNLNASVTFMNLLSYNDLRVDFLIAADGRLVPGSQQFFFNTNTANNGAILLSQTTAFPLVFPATVRLREL